MGAKNKHILGYSNPHIHRFNTIYQNNKGKEKKKMKICKMVKHLSMYLQAK